MNTTDRTALIHRLARARAWNALSESERQLLLRRAEADLTEIEIGREEATVLGWLFVEIEEPAS